MNINNIEEKIKLLNFNMFILKMEANSNYGKIPYEKITEVQNERNILKRKKYNLVKNLERIKKLNKIKNGQINI